MEGDLIEMIYINTNDTEMIVKSDYNQKIVNFMRSRPVRFWDKENRQWILPIEDLKLFMNVIAGYEYKLNCDEVPKDKKQPITLDSIPDWYEFKTKPYEHQLEAIAYGLKHNKFLLADEQGLGKALALNTKVYTPNGYKEMRDIQVGDYVFNKCGKPVKVLATYDNKNVNMYRITFSDGNSVECCEDHLWQIYNHGAHSEKPIVIDTKWFFERNNLGVSRIESIKKGSVRYFIDSCEPVEFEKQDVQLDPYLLGSIIGRGSISKPAVVISMADDNMLVQVKSRLPEGYRLSKVESNGNDSDLYLIRKDDESKNTKENIVHTALKELHLIGTTSHTKFIPDNYKYNSSKVRLDFIRGLIDANHYVVKNYGTLHFSTVSERLKDDMVFMFESFGCNVRVYNRDYANGIYYTIAVRHSNPAIFTTSIDVRKQLKPCKKEKRRKIINVEKIESADAKCITVEDEDGLYLIDHFIVTHNTKQMLDLSQILKKTSDIKHVLIVTCINSLKYNWRNEIQTHTDDTGFILGTRFSKSGRESIGSNEKRLEDVLSIGRNSEIDKHFYLITNIETLRYNKITKIPLKEKKAGVQRYRKQTTYPIVEALQDQIRQGNISMIIADEIHTIKNPSSLGAKALLALDCDYKAALTGTPIMNKPVDAYTPLHWLNFEKHSYYAFEKHYCIMGGFGHHQIVGYKNLPDLQTMLDKCMLRRLKADVLDLPEKIYINDYVEMSSAQYKLYDDVLNSIIADIDRIKLSPNPLTMLIRLRQVTGNPELISSKVKDNPKFDRMMEIIEEVVENGGKCLVFSNWTNVINPAFELVKKNKYNPAKYTGENTDARESEKERFMNDESCKVLLGTVDAMGTGLTLTAANTVIFLDEPWNRAKKDQCEDRVHRIGTTSSPNIITIMCKGTIDERVNNIVYKKGKLSDIIVDKEEDILSNPKLLNYLLSMG
jgi:hypothetical protein